MLSLAVTSCVAFLSVHQAVLFQSYFGDIPPMLAIVLVCSSGFAALYFLQAHHRFQIFELGTFRRGAIVATMLAIPFMISVTAADLIMRFPRDINVPLPASLFFYPAMGYVAEIVFRAVPLSLLAPAIGFFFRSWSIDRRIWVCIVLVATIEAAFQFSFAAREGLSALAIFVAFHLFLIGLVELYIFRRYDFFSMYVFRMIYYAYWHLTWGYLRLQWLF